MNWKKIEESVRYQGYRSMVNKTFKLPDGQIANYDIVANNDFVTIAAFTPEREAILVRQFRPGPEKMLLSFPEGYLDHNEDIRTAARRELLEETGYRAGEIVFQRKMYQAYSTETRSSVLATNCIKVASQKLDSTEFIEVQIVPLIDFKAMLRDSTNDQLVTIDSALLALNDLGW